MPYINKSMSFIYKKMGVSGIKTIQVKPKLSI